MKKENRKYKKGIAINRVLFHQRLIKSFQNSSSQKHQYFRHGNQLLNDILWKNDPNLKQ